MNAQPSNEAPGGAPATLIAELAEQQLVDGVFAVVKRDRLLTRGGQPYLALELRDRSGSIQGRVFRDADQIAARFEVGDAVRVRARVERFRDALQLDVQQLAKAEGAAPEELLPTTYRDIDELEGFYEYLAGEVTDPRLQGLLTSLLGDRKLRAALRRAPCSRGGHHAYLGGLLEHTVAVTQLAHELCQVHPRLDQNLLLTAALVHDLGKLREFRYAAAIELTEEGRMLGHVELGLQILGAHRPRELDDARWLDLAHCVLTHHGPDASPTKRFQSFEAVALYRLNAVDANVKLAFEQGL